ncbi:dUTPase [Bacillus phage BSTP8]|nr:putative dUTPase [Bacillus phage BSP19]QQO90115.1 hypothetical protein BSTP5_054 [Bacillus phage BSTP5]QRI44323.1 dUTPase [Bacillus phage BSTP8]QRI44445.1 dUTPase [Bacillus phage BSTP10]QRI44493.1 dCTP pyrophosphatase OS [Bacillus phage BSTP12]
MDLNKAYETQMAMRRRIIRERGIEWTDEQWILQFLTCINEEVSEVRNELNWKHWKNHKDIDWSAVKEEITDVWIFLIELSISAGLYPEELEEIFYAKTAENHARQDGTSNKPGYAVTDIEASKGLAKLAQAGMTENNSADDIAILNNIRASLKTPFNSPFVKSFNSDN